MNHHNTCSYCKLNQFQTSSFFSVTARTLTSWMLRHKSFCVSGSLTASQLTYKTNFTGCPFSGGQNTRCVYWFTNVHIRVHQLIWLRCTLCVRISPSKSTPICSAWRPCSTSFQNDEIRIKKLCCFWSLTLWNSLPLTVHGPSLSLSQFCARLKTILFCRAYQISS